MKLQAMAVYDEKASLFGHPFFSVTVGQGVRVFTDYVRDPQSSIHKHPEDFKLYCIGQYDDEAGELVAEMPPRFIVTAQEVASRGN